MFVTLFVSCPLFYPADLCLNTERYSKRRREGTRTRKRSILGIFYRFPCLLSNITCSRWIIITATVVLVSKVLTSEPDKHEDSPIFRCKMMGKVSTCGLRDVEYLIPWTLTFVTCSVQSFSASLVFIINLRQRAASSRPVWISSTQGFTCASVRWCSLRNPGISLRKRMSQVRNIWNVTDSVKS
jgi:hypothetical protein